MSIAALIRSLSGGVAQGIIWGIMALGIYITFRVLNLSDLTVDGSFATGGAVGIMLLMAGVNQIIATLVAFLAGIIVGSCTGLIHTKLKIPAILSGILVQFGLYSINLFIQKGRANQAIFRNSDLLVSIQDNTKTIIVGAIIAILIIVLLYWYFGTEQGSAIRATGNNNKMALAQGINIDTMKVIGFALGNGLVSLAGFLMAEYQGYADVNMGRGAIVIGLAAIIIGEVTCEAIFKKGSSFYTRLLFVIFGGIAYYLIIILILWLDVNPDYTKFFTALIVMIFLAIPNIRKEVK